MYADFLFLHVSLPHTRPCEPEYPNGGLKRREGKFPVREIVLSVLFVPYDPTRGRHAAEPRDDIIHKVIRAEYNLIL